MSPKEFWDYVLKSKLPNMISLQEYVKGVLPDVHAYQDCVLKSFLFISAKTPTQSGFWIFIARRINQSLWIFLDFFNKFFIKQLKYVDDV